VGEQRKKLVAGPLGALAVRDVAVVSTPAEILAVSPEDWLAEVYRGQVLTLVPLDERTSVTPLEDEALRREYESYCESQGGGDCLGLLQDGPSPVK
jgi:hypothetical protein